MRKLFSLLTAILFVGTMWAEDATVTLDYEGTGTFPRNASWTSGGSEAAQNHTASGSYCAQFATTSAAYITYNASLTNVKSVSLWGMRTSKNTTHPSFAVEKYDESEEAWVEVVAASTFSLSQNTWTQKTIDIPSKDQFTGKVRLKYTCTSTAVKFIDDIVITYEGASCDKNVTISKGTPEHGDFTLSKTGKQATCNGEVVVVVTPAPAEHYYVSGVTAPNSSSITGPDQDGKYAVTYAQNTNAASEINVTFALKNNFTITWNNNGDQSVTSTVDEGDKPSLPETPESCDASSTTFIGWATEAWAGKIANLTGKTVYYAAADMPAVTAATEYFAVFAKVGAEASVSGGDMSSGATTGWTVTTDGTYSGNGLKFTAVDQYAQSPDLSESNYKDVTVKLTAGHNGGSGSVLTIASYDSGDEVIDSKTFVPTEAYTSQSTTNTFVLSGGKVIKYVRVTMTSKSKNLGMAYCEIFNTPKDDYMTTCAAAGQCETPTFSVEEGSYTEAQSVVISCATDGASIYYTLDGTDPTSASTLYEDPIAVKATTTIKAIAIKEGNTDSGIAEVTYHIIPVAPTFTPAESETVYTEALNVTIAAADGTTIYYTTDGSTPTTESAVYSAAIELNSYGVHTIKAIAVKGGESSSVASATYTLKVPFTSFTELVEKLGKTQTEDISINFTDEVITGVYENSSSVRKGVFLNVKDADGTKDIEIYYNVGEEAVPAAWVANGKLSGTITGNWTVYKGQWELVPTTANWTWSNLTYKAPTPTSIDNTEVEAQAVKVVENGQIFIIRGDKTYTLTGALVK